jgi:lipopolysaccharide transport system permease protein
MTQDTPAIRESKPFKPIVITPVRRLELPDFKEVWESRDLLFFLTRRDLKVRFQQTMIGVLWIALQPIIQMMIFYLIFGIIARVQTDGVPYTIFYLSGYVVWQLFTQIVNSSAFSLLGNIGIITKSYFPRLALPLSTTIGSLVDFAVSFLILLILLIINHNAITWRYLLLPFLLLLTIVFSSGVGLLFGALMVVFRDTKNLLGFILQIWFFMSPIMYPIKSAPESFLVYFYINPITSLIDAYRWVFLHQGDLPSMNYFLLSTAVALVLWGIGAISFRAMENRIADVM